MPFRQEQPAVPRMLHQRSSGLDPPLVEASAEFALLSRPHEYWH
jgi:hypothetical protein